MFICGEWAAEKLKVLRLLPGRNFAFAALVTKMFFHLSLIVGTDIRSLCQANFNGLKMMDRYLTFLSKISLKQQSAHFANDSP
ncbi:hypothetical protein EHT53_03710 [Salmonella enterica]|nr:hypothetical protein [Salmonella enterica]EAP2423961.1 hypothetical protein [Salmonella enterica]EAS8435290.1 hypothetical protein [Salmonella enterica]EBK3747804.1 hypothetical protein [Salmonella enterica]